MGLWALSDAKFDKNGIVEDWETPATGDSRYQDGFSASRIASNEIETIEDQSSISIVDDNGKLQKTIVNHSSGKKKWW